MTGKKLKAAKAQVDRLRLYQPLARPAAQVVRDGQVRRGRRGALPARAERAARDQQLRGSLMLPHGTGRTKTVPCSPRASTLARPRRRARLRRRRGSRDPRAGGLDRLRRRARNAGHDGRGRPPRPRARAAGQDAQPRSGTITFDIAKAVEEIKAGKIEYRTENRAASCTS